MTPGEERGAVAPAWPAAPAARGLPGVPGSDVSTHGAPPGCTFVSAAAAPPISDMSTATGPWLQVDDLRGVSTVRDAMMGGVVEWLPCIARRTRFAWCLAARSLAFIRRAAFWSAGVVKAVFLDEPWKTILKREHEARMYEQSSMSHLARAATRFFVYI